MVHVHAHCEAIFVGGASGIQEHICSWDIRSEGERLKGSLIMQPCNPSVKGKCTEQQQQQQQQEQRQPDRSAAVTAA